MKKFILLVSLALGSWGAYAQHVQGSGDHKNTEEMSPMAPMFKDQAIGNAYSKYIELKNGLVTSDALKISDAAALLVLALQDVNDVGKVLEQARMVSKAKNLEEQRKMFASLSNEMVALIKNAKLSMGSIYVDYCPMANNSSGAYWLSNEAAIANPYFGSKMLTCGSVKEIIE
ncbi:DUF3347 domain-containing protein [uncultured Algoriphagus sp.]|uniref:DUF3347 domain-containing protein n=1 Tax=uncultured Algoriphagus sp. TaxID=417365 RepID=UPI0030EBBD39|tara:strand:+ start:7104 stop:7622 length:519 start_codon:yes stop_codon:yes gene_type:complete